MTDNTDQRYTNQPTIKVSDFEGPLDLLLHLIRSSEMDIYDIQIAEITAQYLEFLHQMQSNQLEVAGEYFVMAATLMSIKSKMLLPADEDEEVVEDVEDDPRQELVDQLLEYKRYKQAASELHEKEQQRQQEFTRPAISIPDDVAGAKVSPGITLGQLQQAFATVIKRKHLSQPITQTVQSERTSLTDKIKMVLNVVKHAPTIFDDLFNDQTNRDELVTTFLAVLELCKHQAILIEQTDNFNPLVLSAGPQSEEFENEQFSTD